MRSRRFDPSVDRPRGFRDWIQPRRVPALIAAWRAEAAENARRLLGRPLGGRADSHRDVDRRQCRPPRPADLARDPVHPR